MKNANFFTPCPSCHRKENEMFPYIHQYAKIVFRESGENIVITSKKTFNLFKKIPGMLFYSSSEIVCGTHYNSELCCGDFFVIHMPRKGNLPAYVYQLDSNEEIGDEVLFYSKLLETISVKAMTIHYIGSELPQFSSLAEASCLS